VWTAVQSEGDDPASWRTWILTSADELRPAAPVAPTQADIDEVIAAQAAPTEAEIAAIELWGTGPAILPWSKLSIELTNEFDIGGFPQSRFMAIYHTALHDAVIAAWDAQVAYGQPSPAATSDLVIPAAGVDPSQPSYPSETATLAGAAATVLAYLLPDAEPGRFDALAQEAADSRIAAGAAFPSDVEAGLALGQAIGAKAVTRAQGDGSDAQWDPATMPTGPGFWQPTPPGMVETPVAPMAGSWQSWVTTGNDQFRPAPPPEYGTPAWQAELETVQEIAANRTFEQERAAAWWGSNSPWELTNDWVWELIQRDGLDSPHAARIVADMYVAMADAMLAIWDAKYTWWTARPITEDPTLVTVVPTPPYPSYPSGYSAAMGSGTTVVGHYFPEVSDDMAVRATEAAASRGWAGIHYVVDDDVGLTMGRQVGRLVCSLARTDPVDGAA
jgi:membrane-associated phospholipid phosphatase